MINSVDVGFGHWFSGFTDGEGYFGIAQRSNGSSTFEFKIGLRGDDGEILRRIKSNLGFGYFLELSAKGDKNPVSFFRVRKNEDCIKLIDLFDAYPLRSKKKKDYYIWKSAFEYKISHPRDSDKNKIISMYSERLKKVKEYDT